MQHSRVSKSDWWGRRTRCEECRVQVSCRIIELHRRRLRWHKRKPWIHQRKEQWHFSNAWSDNVAMLDHRLQLERDDPSLDEHTDGDWTGAADRNSRSHVIEITNMNQWRQARRARARQTSAYVRGQGLTDLKDLMDLTDLRVWRIWRIWRDVWAGGGWMFVLFWEDGVLGGKCREGDVGRHVTGRCYGDVGMLEENYGTIKGEITGDVGREGCQGDVTGMLRGYYGDYRDVRDVTGMTRGRGCGCYGNVRVMLRMLEGVLPQKQNTALLMARNLCGPPWLHEKTPRQKPQNHDFGRCIATFSQNQNWLHHLDPQTILARGLWSWLLWAKPLEANTVLSQQRFRRCRVNVKGFFGTIKDVRGRQGIVKGDCKGMTRELYENCTGIVWELCEVWWDCVRRLCNGIV